MTFETEDGKFKVAGTIEYFVDPRGRKINQAKTFSSSWSLIIKKENGKLTPPVPLNRLNKDTIATARKVFKQRFRKPSIEGSFNGLDEESLNKFVAFGKKLAKEKLTPQEVKKRLRNFTSLLSPEEKSNPTLQCYLLAVQTDLGMPASLKLKKLASEYSNFWICWRCLVVSDLLEKGGKAATGTLQRYQAYLIDLYDLRDENDDNTDIAQELTWISDTAQQFVNLPYKNRLLSKISASEDSFEVIGKITSAKAIKEEYAKDREAFDKINEAEKEEKLAQLIRDANQVYDTWIEELNKNWAFLTNNYGLTQDRLLIAENNLQIGLNQYYSARSHLNSISSRKSSAQSDVDRIRSRISDEQGKSFEERDDDLISDLRSDLSRAESEVRALEVEYSAQSGIVSRLAANAAGLRSIYNGLMRQLQAVYFEICKLTNSARNYGKLFIFRYQKAIENDYLLESKLAKLGSIIRDKLSQMPQMPEIKLGWKASKEVIKDEERVIAKDLMIRLADLENSIRSRMK